MAKNYTYPRVDITTNVLSRYNKVETPDTSSLFVAFVSDRGPNKVVEKIHSLSEFISVYGDLSYEKNGLTAFNIYNWLSNGGTLYAYRLNDGTKARSKADDKNASLTAELVEAKYCGAWYNSIKITGAIATSGDDADAKYYWSFTVSHGKETLEKFANIVSDRLTSISSEYITFKGKPSLEQEIESFEISFDGGSDCNSDNSTQDSLLENFWTGKTESASTTKTALQKALGNPLETPVELILDAGYSANIKKAISDYVNNTRTDIVAILDCSHTFNYNAKPTYALTDKTKNDTSNVAIYEQYFLIHDSTFTDRDIYVSPTYFLSKLLPYNDSQYGIQYTTAGINRGLLEDAEKVYSSNELYSNVLDADDKESLFTERINYAEKTSREISFQSQRMYDNSTAYKYTALSFLNNARTLVRIKHELTALGRQYLFEFNDSVTLSKMETALNRYMNDWVANRALSYANVTVQAGSGSESVDVYLDIKFTGTIEVISVEITIE